MYSINYFEIMGKKYSEASGTLAQFQKLAQLPYKESPIEIICQRTVSKLKVIDLPGAGCFRNMSQDALFTLSPSEGKGCHGLGDELGWRSKRNLKHWHQARLFPVDFKCVENSAPSQGVQEYKDTRSCGYLPCSDDCCHLPASPHHPPSLNISSQNSAVGLACSCASGPLHPVLFS